MQINVREWLKMFDTRLEILATAIDLKIDNIKDFEYVNFIKSKLDFDVIQELDLKFAAIHPDPYEWGTVTKAQLSKLIVEQFGQKRPDVASVIKCFGVNRYKSQQILMLEIIIANGKNSCLFV